MLKIRRPLGRLIFDMGIAIPGKTVFLIETPPWKFYCLIEYDFPVVITETTKQLPNHLSYPQLFIDECYGSDETFIYKHSRIAGFA